MQLFPCPFCGLRDETEFTFGGEAGKARPEPAGEVLAENWARFLYTHPNPKGFSREIWVHAACGEFFLLERDTVSHAVHASHSLRRSDAVAPAGDGVPEAQTAETTFAAEAPS